MNTTARGVKISRNDPADGPLGLMRLVAQGFSVGALDVIARRTSPDDTAFKYQVVPKATLERRKRAVVPTLSPEESAKVVRITRLMDLAADVWKSDAAARAFLFRPHPLLDMQTPMAMTLMNEFGAEAARDVLMGLKYGTGV